MYGEGKANRTGYRVKGKKHEKEDFKTFDVSNWRNDSNISRDWCIELERRDCGDNTRSSLLRPVMLEVPVNRWKGRMCGSGCRQASRWHDISSDCYNFLCTVRSRALPGCRDWGGGVRSLEGNDKVYNCHWGLCYSMVTKVVACLRLIRNTGSHTPGPVQKVYLIKKPRWLRAHSSLRWASLMAQGRICLQCRRPGFDHWVGKIPLEEEMATHSSILAWRIPWTVWWATIQGVTKSQTQLSNKSPSPPSLRYTLRESDYIQEEQSDGSAALRAHMRFPASISRENHMHGDEFYSSKRH